MTRRKRRRIRVVLEAYAPPEGPGLTPVREEIDYVATYEGLQVNATPLARFGLDLALLAAWWSPVWILGRPRTLAALPRRLQAQALSAMSRHKRFLVRELAFLLKIAAGTALLGAPTVRARSGYDLLPQEATP